MRVQDLIDALRDLDAPDAEIRVAHQPSWPFEYAIDDIQFVSNEKRDADPPEEPPEDYECEGACNKCPYQDGCQDHNSAFACEGDDITVYLVEGRQIGYLPGYVKHLIGW